MGGAVAIEYALSGYSPAALALVSSGARLRVAPALFDLMKNADAEAWADGAMQALYDRPPEEPLRSFAWEDLTRTPRDLYIKDFTASNRWDALDRVGTVDVPVQIIVGESDRLTPVKYAAYLSETLHDARCNVLPATGHMPMLEKPREVSTILLEFARELFVDLRNPVT